LVEEDHHPEEILLTEEDHILVHPMENTEDVVEILEKEKESIEIEIEIVNTSKAEEESETVLDQDKRSIKREDKVDQILQENDSSKLKLRPDLYNQGNHSLKQLSNLFMNQTKHIQNSKIYNFNFQK
jgi:hypothetical protein